MLDLMIIFILIIAVIIFIMMSPTKDKSKPRVHFAETRDEIIFDKKTGNFIDHVVVPA